MSTTTVTRGSVLVYKRFGIDKVSAVLSRPRCEELRRSVGGTIVNARGFAAHYSQGLRVLDNPSEAIALAAQVWEDTRRRLAAEAAGATA